MFIPRDKIAHFLAGAVIATGAAAVWFIVAQAGLVSMSGAWLGAVLSAGVAGLVKERADYEDNKVHHGMHDVEVLDALATALGSAPVAAALLVGGV